VRDGLGLAGRFFPNQPQLRPLDTVERDGLAGRFFPNQPQLQPLETAERDGLAGRFFSNQPQSGLGLGFGCSSRLKPLSVMA